VKYAARKMVRLLNLNYGKYWKIVNNDSHYEFGADERICKDADRVNKTNGPIQFVTYDLCCRVIADGKYDLNPYYPDNSGESIYKGYKEFVGSTNDINTAIENINLDDWYMNEYLIAVPTDGGKPFELRYNGEEFVPLRLPSSKFIKGKNALQRCALDMLANPNITICGVLGNYGSGKSYLTMRMGLYSVREKGYQSKIVGVREYRGEGEEIGFLPGEKEAKLNDFFLPLAQQLDGGEFELESMKQRGEIEINTPFFMKGTTYDNSIILVDEAEDLKEKQIKLIGTRVGQNGRIFFSGDYKQSLICDNENNALVRTCNTLKGKPEFACIYLDDDVRSDTSKIFATLFED